MRGLDESGSWQWHVEPFAFVSYWFNKRSNCGWSLLPFDDSWVHGLWHELLLPSYFLCLHSWHSTNYFICQILQRYGDGSGGEEANNFVIAECLAFFLLIKVENLYLAAEWRFTTHPGWFLWLAENLILQCFQPKSFQKDLKSILNQFPLPPPPTQWIFTYTKRKKKKTKNISTFLYMSFPLNDYWSFQWIVDYLALTRCERGKINMFFQNQKALVVLAHSLCDKGKERALKSCISQKLNETRWQFFLGSYCYLPILVWSWNIIWSHIYTCSQGRQESS